MWIVDLEKSPKHTIFPLSKHIMKKLAFLFLAFGCSIFAFGQSATLQTYVNSEPVQGSIVLKNSSRIAMKVIAPHSDQPGYVYEFGEIILEWENAAGEVQRKELLKSQIQESPTLLFPLKPAQLEDVPSNARIVLAYVKRYDRDKNMEQFQIPLEQMVHQIHH